MFEINKLHPFVDGCKRTGLEATDVFLRINGYELVISNDEGLSKSLETASCSIEKSQLDDWIKNRTRKRRESAS